MPTTQLARCVVHINGQEAPYLRAGQGTPVIMLVDGPEAAGDVEALVTALSPHHRVTMPTLPAGDRVDRLRSFLDGIGLLHTHVIAADGWVAPALAFTLLDPERVDRLALIDTQAGEPEVTAALFDRLAGAGHPLFVARESGYNNERSGFHVGAATVRALIHFFSGAARGSA